MTRDVLLAEVPTVLRTDRLCRDWHKTMPSHACWTAVTGDSHIAFFDRNGLMIIDAQLSD